MKRPARIALLLLVTLTVASAQTIKSDWRFPSPDIPAKYNTKLKTDVYDLGDGFTAIRKKFGDSEVAVVGFPPVPDEIEDADFALAVASKCFRLPKLLKDTVLEQKDKFEYLFRTESGRTVGVTLAHERKTAVVRLLPLKEDAPLQ
jgi:hypothetical protein